MSKHEWRETTAEGEVRFVCAQRHAARWRFRTRLKSEADWTHLETLPLEDLEYLREVLFNKYQRRRVPSEHVEEIEAMIRKREDAR